jgi:hypothetical protein
VATAIIIAVATSTFALAGLGGWGHISELKIGKPAKFCERSKPGIIREPVNTWSNLGFLLVAMIIAFRRDRYLCVNRGGLIDSSGSYSAALIFALLTLGLGSGLMHASAAHFGQWLDNLGMFSVIWFFNWLNFSRLFNFNQNLFLSVYILIFLIVAMVYFPLGFAYPEFKTMICLYIFAELAIFFHRRPRFYTVIPFLLHTWLLGLTERVIIWVLLAALPVHRDRRIVRDYRIFLGAVICFGIARFIGSNSRYDESWCVPDSLWQPHAAWHLLCAVALYWFYCYLNRRPQPYPAKSREGLVDDVTHGLGATKNAGFFGLFEKLTSWS